MRKNTTRNKKQIRSSNKKEAREDFSFYIGIDLGDKNSDVCVKRIAPSRRGKPSAI